MSRPPLTRFANAALKIIDGDRGDNYPQKAEFNKEGYCVFLNTGNVTRNGFNFGEIDFISEERDSLLRKGKASRKDIVLTTRGTIGNVAYYAESIQFPNVRINSGMVLIRTDEKKIDSSYLYAFLRSDIFRKQILSNGSGSAQPQLPIVALNNIVIPLPLIEVQRKIGAVLSAIDAKINLNNRTNAELEALAKTIYDYWFVQFDFPDAKGRPYKTSGGKMVWNDTLKREIPAGWDTTNIGNACNTILGGTPDTKNPEYWDNADIPWLSSGETSCFPVVGSEQSITSAGIRDSAARLLPAGTVIVSIVRHIRPSILAIPAATNQSVVGILQTDLLPSSYLYPAICREVPRWMALRTGAQQPHINKATVDETLILKPAKTAVSAYREIADPIFKRINIAANENRELTQLRDWLLPLLMNGQVRVA